MKAVDITNLSCGYGKSQILYDVDFEASEGTITGIIGANGSGKSTLLKSMFGLCDVMSGRITTFGRDITRTPAYAMRGQGISYMAQRQNVFAELSLRENLVVAANGESHDHILDSFSEIKPFYHSKAKTLSGGQRQLLAMAMTLLGAPSVMLFDEPTAALSPKNSQIILEKIKQINTEAKNCTILVEQNVRRALEFCDYVYLLASGKVAYFGRPQALLDDEDLAAKYLGV